MYYIIFIYIPNILCRVMIIGTRFKIRSSFVIIITLQSFYQNLGGLWWENPSVDIGISLV